jgi:hypothetical protein
LNFQIQMINRISDHENSSETVNDVKIKLGLG